MGGQKLGEAGFSSTVGRWLRLLVCAVTAVLVASCARVGQPPAAPNPVSGLLAKFLVASTDLGPARGEPVKLTVALRDSSSPQALTAWAESRRLSVQWRPDHKWAYLEGASQDVAGAFAVAVHDYRSPDGQLFYAAQQDPRIPEAVAGEVTDIGRILSYRPPNLVKPPIIPLDVPNNGLSPNELRETYGAAPLGLGSGQTIVFFEVDSFTQKDLDRFAAKFGVPRFQPEVYGTDPGWQVGETAMDLQVAHGIAPAAKKVVYYLPGGGYDEMADQMTEVDKKFPGALWSLSLGYGCDLIDKPNMLDPVRDAVRAAEKHGTSVFISSGDTGGYECKGYNDNPPDKYTPPPTGDEIGVSSLASIPEVTDVGGTSLSDR